MEFYSVVKKTEFFKFLGKCMELENIIVREVSQAQKMKGHMWNKIQIQAIF
jgi:hypothetical protein